MKTHLLLLILLSSFSLYAQATPPNIVFLMTDDQRWDSFGCYGRPEFETHTIDKLSAEGLTFDRAYHAVAICMPSRVSVMTGRYFASHNSGFTYPHNTPVSQEDFSHTYHAQLKKHGYRSGFVGKLGFNVEGGKETLKEHFDFYLGNGTHTNVGAAQWADTADAFKDLSADRKRTDRTLKKGDAMIRFLETQPKGKPFVLSISFDAVKNDSDNDMHVPDKKHFAETPMSVPQNWVEGANKKLPEVVQKNARGHKLHLARTSTPQKYQRLVRRFAAQGVTVDKQVARLIEKLKEIGELENTVIIYTSDNGRYHGSHGLYDKALLHEESVKAPLIIWDGRGMKRHGKRETLLTSSVDLAPTILDLAGLKIPEQMQGRQLTELLDHAVDKESWRDAVLIENLFLQEIHSKTVRAKNPDLQAINEDVISNNRSYRSRGVRTKKWKYFIYYEHSPVIEELYDLEADPLETKNLAQSPEYHQVREALREKTESLYTKYK